MKAWLDSFFAQRTILRFGGGDPQFLSDLMKSAREGHLCLRSLAPSLPSQMVSDGSEPFPQTPIVQEANRYYLQRNWVYETTICREVKRLLKKMEAPDKWEQFIEREALLPAQARAIEHAIFHQLTILSGGPGTGKTYTAGHLVKTLARLSPVKRLYKVCLAAPTGRAAQHLSSSLKNRGQEMEVKTETLHRLLHLQPGKSKLFTGQKIDADLIIVDEASMIDVDLWAHLLEAVGAETRLVLIGDPDQLPPVEAGSIFADLSDLFGVRLERSMRTDKKDLQSLGEAIRVADIAGVLQLFSEGVGAPLPTQSDFFFEKIDPPVYKEKPDPSLCLRYFDRLRILSALRQGPLGVDALNLAVLQKYTQKLSWGDYWAIPIMVSSNDPRLGLYNGSCGILIGAFRESFRPREGIAYFPDSISGEMRPFNPAVLPHFEWAFALSVHKSQGSEFEHVFALFPPGSERFGREALYTAATRAKKSLKMAIDEVVLKEMLANCARKASGIKERF